MGLLKHLVGWPVTGPAFLVGFCVESVRGATLREVVDEEPVREQLLELQLRLELGEIDEETYLEREAELMRRFREVRAWRERLGLPTRGGPMRAPDAGPAAADASVESGEAVGEDGSADVAREGSSGDLTGENGSGSADVGGPGG